METISWSGDPMVSVNLSELVEAVSLAPEDETLYVNRLTGKNYAIADEEMAIMGEVHDDMFPEIEVEIIDELRSVLSSGDWIALPSAAAEGKTLEAFCKTIEEGGGAIAFSKSSRLKPRTKDRPASPSGCWIFSMMRIWKGRGRSFRKRL